MNEAEEKLLIVLKQVMEEKLTSINVEVHSVYSVRILYWCVSLSYICVCVDVEND